MELWRRQTLFLALVTLPVGVLWSEAASGSGDRDITRSFVDDPVAAESLAKALAAADKPEGPTTRPKPRAIASCSPTSHADVQGVSRQ